MTDWDDDIWDRVDAVVRRWDDSWQNRFITDLVELAPSTDDPAYEEILVTLIKVDQEHRWRSGQEPLLEEYLDVWPELKEQADILVKLLTAECGIRGQQGSLPTRVELQERFPQICAEIDLPSIEAPFNSDGAVVKAKRPGPVARQAVRVRCPYCENRIKAVDEGILGDFNCLACGRNFNVATGDTKTSNSGTSTDPFAKEVNVTATFRPISPTMLPGGDAVEFGDYELLEEIARGGMGIVFKARQRSLNRIVAVKTIQAGQLASEEEVKRFHTEAEAAANLDHPGIVPIYEVGQYQGQHFFSMGFVEGMSLAARVSEGPLRPHKAAELLTQIVEAVAYAHEQGVIHRDLKPANILLDQHGRPRVTDFGLAKMVEADIGLTETGQVMGTPSYMPPEQASGDTAEIGALSDVYSLGAILYCLLTGRPPFQGSTPIDTTRLVLQQDPVSPRQLNTAVDRDLETICLKCLEKEAVRRYSSAQELADDLHRFLTRKPIHALPVSHWARLWRWCKRQPVVAALVAAVFTSLAAGLVVSIYFAFESEGRRIQSDQRLVEVERFTRLSTRLVLDRYQELNESGASGAALVFLSRGLQMSLPKDDSLQNAIRCQITRLAQEIHPLTRVITTDGPVSFAAWGPDGQWIVTAASQSHAPQFWNATSGTRIGAMTTSLTRNAVPVGPVTAPQPSFRHVMFPAPAHLVLVSAANKGFLWDTRTRLPYQWGSNAGSLGYRIASWIQTHHADILAVSPNSKFLLTARSNELQLWDVSTLQPSGDPVALDGIETPRVVALNTKGEIAIGTGENGVCLYNPLKDGASPFQQLESRAKITAIAFSPNNETLCTGSEDGLVKLWDLSTGYMIGRAISHASAVNVVGFSTDANFVLTGGSDGALKIWRFRVPIDHVSGRVDQSEDRRGGEPQTEAGESASIIAFSPDGQGLVMGSDSGHLSLWNVATQEVVYRVSAHEGSITAIAFSPDGSAVASGSLDRTVRMWDTRGLAAMGKPLRHARGIGSVFFDGDGKTLVSQELRYRPRLWDVETGREREVPTALHASKLFETNGELALALTWGTKTCELFHLRTGISRSEGISLDSLDRVAFSSDGTSIVAGGSNRAVQLVHLMNGTPNSHVRGHDSEITCLGVSPDGRSALAVTDAARATLWEFGTGHRIGCWSLTTNRRIDDAVKRNACEFADVWCFSPDNRFVFSARGFEKSLWNVASACLVDSSLAVVPITTAAFAPDSSMLVTGHMDGTLTFNWLPQPVYGEPQRIALWVTSLTGLQMPANNISVRPIDQKTLEQVREDLTKIGGPPENDPTQPRISRLATESQILKSRWIKSSKQNDSQPVPPAESPEPEPLPKNPPEPAPGQQESPEPMDLMPLSPYGEIAAMVRRER